MEIKIRRVHESYYRAWCPGLPGCSITAGTQDEAQEKILDAAKGYLASMNLALPRELKCLFHMEMPMRS